MTAAYPRFFQTKTMITMTRLSVGALNHCGLEAPPSRSSAPSTPTTGSKMNSQTRPTPTPESTNGEKTADRAKPTPRIRWLGGRGGDAGEAPPGVRFVGGAGDQRPHPRGAAEVPPGKNRGGGEDRPGAGE